MAYVNGSDDANQESSQSAVIAAIGASDSNPTVQISSARLQKIRELLWNR